MSAPNLTIYLDDKPYWDTGNCVAVCVEFSAKDGSAFVTSIVYKNWVVVGRSPSTEAEARHALERLMAQPKDTEWVRGWNTLSREDQWKVLAVLRTASSINCLLSPA